ncbi:PFL_4669 family integrating conjugative element protein [Candidatus Thiodubiliella endoseptemdiera]|uniref:PFL_4669 family integrating conjugative element protein n=1 Tax=Candidatus Thiodubiliella endoseptemdiera TaxID=2738886 RepID=UPI0034E035AC
MKGHNNTNRPGPLRNSNSLELNTKEAVALFYGRKKTEELNAIVGLNVFSSKIKDINNAAHNNDPYADFFLLKIDTALKETEKRLIDWQNDFTELSDKSLIKINQGGSTKPVTLETSFSSVYANIALSLLKRADNLMLTIYALKHIGMINRAKCNKHITEVNRMMRKAFLSADGYKYLNINRRDVEQKTARYHQAHIAMKFKEELPHEILNKSLRAEHAPNIVIDPNDIFKKPKKTIGKKDD